MRIEHCDSDSADMMQGAMCMRDLRPLTYWSLWPGRQKMRRFQGKGMLTHWSAPSKSGRPPELG